MWVQAEEGERRLGAIDGPMWGRHHWYGSDEDAERIVGFAVDP